MQIQEWLSDSFDIKDVYGCIGTDLLSDLLLNNILICCLSKNTSETASKYFDTQTRCLPLFKDTIININNANTRMAVGFFRYQRCVWMYRH